jgi:signal transduction histidine kinase
MVWVISLLLHKPFLMKLISRYNRFLFPILIFLFILSTVTSYYLIKNVLQNELDEILLRSQSRIEKYTAANNTIPVINSFDDQQVRFQKIEGVLTDSGFKSTTQFIPEQNKEHLSRSLTFKLLVNNQPYKVTIIEPLEGTKHLTRLILKIAIVTIFFTLLFLLLINRKLLSKIWQPFYQSLATIKQFNINSTDKLQFPESGINEFNLMNSHFSSASENARKEYKNLKEFSENASHEIQTPLAIIHSKLDLMAQQENLTEPQSKLLQSVYTSVNKLSNLQQSLLLLTKIDNRQFNRNCEIDLEEEIKSKIEQFRELWQSKSITHTAQTEASIINTDKELLEILLNNLLGNATRHNIPGGTIGIKVLKNGMEISNTGFTALDDDKIFKRFYKGIPSAESNGLGLSIIKEICEVSKIEVSYLFKDYQHCFQLKW